MTTPTPQRGSGMRSPAQAGKFYPAEDAARRSMIDGLLTSPPPKKQKVLAAMVPHAGLRYSGAVAADRGNISMYRRLPSSFHQSTQTKV